MSGQGGGGGGLGLPEYKLKVLNICEMHGTGGHEAVVFDRFQRYVEIVRKLTIPLLRGLEPNPQKVFLR